ncbi:glycoside hydrolase family protein [Sedimentitalea todarodis]|uniref:Glycosyl hydrolase family 32 N-terminal domain-containing protein n=1 Tax=Sedimentitalea todarodis TaxID=1631240 RepID=A0ABU3VBP6_9RHOB|nr:hypothetical protein [Sedimentitalea todarodis]MDU9003608.1 hypothetical protein [Sedimentitalea todarodis]
MIRGVVATILITCATTQVQADDARACARTFKDWTPDGQPVLRDRVPEENYEVASDSHVFRIPDGRLRMVYAGDSGGTISIKLARSNDWTTWRDGPVLIGPDQGGRKARKKETPFYRRAENGEHQIFFIGYANETTYRSQVFLAVADKLNGPYRMKSKPVIPIGQIGGESVGTITSPGIVEHDGKLFMTFVAWDDYRNVSQIWPMGAVSDDDGRTWKNIRKVKAPVAMEGQITRTPDGRFLSVRNGEFQETEAIFLGCATHPFGPYHELTAPVITKSGGRWDRDEITAPQITFDPVSGAAHLFYTGAQSQKGWWILHARRGD